MKNITKRSISFLMAFILCISVLLSISFSVQAANVDYVYSSNNYILNWGTREELATFLSQNAIAFYEKNNVTYDELEALSGSSNVNTVPSSELYKELQDLMKDNHKKQTSYGDTRYMYQYTDCQNSCKTSTAISSFYSGEDIGPGWDAGATWNREHTWPKSKTAYKSVNNGSINEATDIMTLRPAGSSENSSRGNKAYGTQTNSSFFNPNHYAGDKYDLRGDCARIMLYTYVRWGNTSYMWGSSGVIQSKDVLLQWVEEDPVDTWELGRNDSVQSITGTRNVFVDYPELVFILFGEEVPTTYSTPSGEAKDTSSSNNTTPKPTQVPTTKPTQVPSNTPQGNVDTTCKHPNIYTVAAEEPRCELGGFTEGSYCPDCKKYISGHEVIPGLEHQYSSDCDTTCSNCTKTREVNTAHTFNGENVCTVCNAQKDTSSNLATPDNTQNNQNIDNQNTSNNWVVPVIIIGVVVVGAVVVLIIFRKKIFKNKK